MDMKTSELAGARLDAWVEKAEEVHVSQGYERRWVDGVPAHNPNYEPWNAVMPLERGTPWRVAVWLPPDFAVVYGTGPTPLTAIMRAYVASKFGEEVTP
jgi:hypothetical protein